MLGFGVALLVSLALEQYLSLGRIAVADMLGFAVLLDSLQFALHHFAVVQVGSSDKYIVRYLD